MNFKLEELTKDNEAQYLEQVANLEQVVMENMEARGQTGQLFPTGREDISAYAHSKENSVFVAVDENGKVIAATYITIANKIIPNACWPAPIAIPAIPPAVNIIVSIIIANTTQIIGNIIFNNVLKHNPHALVKLSNPIFIKSK